MTYSVVPAKSTGDLLAASDWGTYVKDNFADHEARLLAQEHSGCRVVRTTNQSIPDSVWTAVSFTAETIDHGGWFPATGTTVTVPAGAIPSGSTTLLLSCQIQLYWAGNVTGVRSVRFLKNGAEFASDGDSTATAGNLGQVKVAPDVDAVAGDTITIEVFQSSGGALNLIGATFPLAGVVRRVGYY